MEPLRLDTLAAQVVAWHNRHPLARRISAAQVQAMGYVVLPGMQVWQPEDAAAPTGDHAAAADAVAAVPVPVPAPAPGPADSDQAAEGAVEAEAHQPTATSPDSKAVGETAADATPDPTPAVETGTDISDATAIDVPPQVGAEAPAVELRARWEEGAPAVTANNTPNSAPNEEPAPAQSPSLRARLAARPAQAGPASIEAASPASVKTPAQPMPSRPAAAGAAGAAPVAFAPMPPAAGQANAADPFASPFRLACSEKLLDHTPPQRLAQWAQQHARVLAVRLPAGAPVRQVARDAALSAVQPGALERPVDLLLRAATLAVGQRRLRLLVGPGVDPAVLGPRLWSLPRVAVACLPLLLLPLTGGLAWWLGAQSARQALTVAGAAPPKPVDASAAAASAPSVATRVDPNAARSAAAPSSAPLHSAQAASEAFASYAASAARAAEAAALATAEAAAAAAEPPIDTEPRLGTVNLPPLGPLFADPRLEPTRDRRLAARAARAARLTPAVAAASAPVANTLAAATALRPVAKGTTPVSATPAVQAAGVEDQPGTGAAATTPAAAPAPTAAYALTTRPLRTAAESEQMQAAMRTLLALTLDSTARVQRVPVGDDWRVMGGPFASRAAAERTRTLLLARGVKTEVMDIPPAAGASAMAAATAPAGR